MDVAYLTDVVSVAGGIGHSLAADGRGDVDGWGWNGFRQVGDGTTVDRHVPHPLTAINDTIVVAAGAFHSLALRAPGQTVHSWGWNAFGQLGDTTTETRGYPAGIPTPGPIRTIGGGLLHTVTGGP